MYTILVTYRLGIAI